MSTSGIQTDPPEAVSVNPPVEAPPEEAPPVEAPPEEAPPVEAPPVEAPPEDAWDSRELRKKIRKNSKKRGTRKKIEEREAQEKEAAEKEAREVEKKRKEAYEQDERNEALEKQYQTLINNKILMRNAELERLSSANRISRTKEIDGTAAKLRFIKREGANDEFVNNALRSNRNAELQQISGEKKVTRAKKKAQDRATTIRRGVPYDDLDSGERLKNVRAEAFKLLGKKPSIKKIESLRDNLSKYRGGYRETPIPGNIPGNPYIVDPRQPYEKRSRRAKTKQ